MDLKRIPTLKALALRFPKVRINLNHCGGFVGPHMTPQDTEQWRRDIKDCGDVVLAQRGF